jgi:hypothetical protein
VALSTRPAGHLLVALALLAAPRARANVTGYAEVQAQSTQNTTQPVGGTVQTTATTLVMETLSLHYAGLPFGPSVAVATAGGTFTNVDDWDGSGQRSRSQALSFDTSLGLLPRRAVPLRLYAGGTVLRGTGQYLATAGVGPSLLYGGALNLEPDRLMPGLRLDISEARGSRPGVPDLADVQRRLTANGFLDVGGQRFNLALRLENDHREAASDISSKALTFEWGSAHQQTTLLASEVRRSLALLNGITSERLLSASGVQRWRPSVWSTLSARLSESGAPGASGTLGDARATVTWRPVDAHQQLTVSGSGGAGFTRTASPTGEVTGESYGAGARVAYGRPLGLVSGLVSLGAATSICNCRFGNDGTTTSLDATISAALLPGARRSCQVEYSIVSVTAPLSAGGDRLENHARAFGWLGVGDASNLTASIAYDDGWRQLLDITTGQAVTLPEQAISASIGGSSQLGRFYPSAEVRHARNTTVTEGSPFVAGSITKVRSVTSALATGSWNPLDRLGLQAQLRWSLTELSGTPSIASAGASLYLGWRLGRLLFTAQYQLNLSQLSDAAPTRQQSIRASLSRPFEF